MRLRENGIALMADVTAMFYQVYVTPEDSDYLRYLWWPEGDMNKEPEEYQMKEAYLRLVAPVLRSENVLKTTEVIIQLKP